MASVGRQNPCRSLSPPFAKKIIRNAREDVRSPHEREGTLLAITVEMVRLKLAALPPDVRKGSAFPSSS